MSTSSQKPPFDHLAGSFKQFSFLHPDVERSPLNEFLEMTLDISTGLETCLGLVYESEINSSHNEHCDEGTEVIPTLGLTERHDILRFTIATSKLLRLHAAEKLDWLNDYKRVESKEG